MKIDTPEDALFDLPDFEIPQRESPCASQWTYEEAAKAFDELAESMRLREQAPIKENIPLFEI